MNKSLGSLSLLLSSIIVFACAKQVNYVPDNQQYAQTTENSTLTVNQALYSAENVTKEQLKKAEDLLKQDEAEASEEVNSSENNLAKVENKNVVTTQNIITPSKTTLPPVELPSGVKKFDLTMKNNPFPLEKVAEPSALCFDDNGELFTVADKMSYSIYKLSKGTNKNITVYNGIEAVKMNKMQILKSRLKKKNRFDFEGLEYYKGVFYVADERDRKVFTIDKQGNINDLGVDSIGYMKANNIIDNVQNSGIEGLTIDPQNQKMYLMKERQESAILVVDLKTNKVVNHFKLKVPGTVEPAFTDAAFFEGSLYVLVRSHRQILKVNPENGQLLSIYDYRKHEENPEYVYKKIPTLFGEADKDGYGVMEGLAVTKDSFFVATDNNRIPLNKHLFNNKAQLFVFNKPE